MLKRPFRLPYLGYGLRIAVEVLRLPRHIPLIWKTAEKVDALKGHADNFERQVVAKLGQLGFAQERMFEALTELEDRLAKIDVCLNRLGVTPTLNEPDSLGIAKSPIPEKEED
jgi:hypothetical protein